MDTCLPAIKIPLPAAYVDRPLIEYYEDLLKVAEQWNWLSKFHIVDYMTKNFWNELPEDWREVLLRDDVTVDVLLRLASLGECPDTWPDTLKDFAEQTRRVSLNRTPPRELLNAFSDPVSEYILAGMTGKKLHEVEIMGSLIRHVAQNLDINNIIDLGAGQGYLSRVLAYQHKLNIIAVDSSTVQTTGAQHFQKRAEKHLSKKKKREQKQLRKQLYIRDQEKVADSSNDDNETGTTTTPTEEESLTEQSEDFSLLYDPDLDKPVVPWDPATAPSMHLYHVNAKVLPQTLPTLLDLWTAKVPWRPEDAQPINSEQWLICGLHACGDLSPTMIQSFLAASDVRAVVNVGCCYHMLSEEHGAAWERRPPKERDLHHEGNYAFPLSSLVKDRGFHLGFTARMLACQAPQRWILEHDQSVHAFEHHYYRALLQHLMVTKGLCTVDNPPVIGKLNKKRDFADFPTYTKAALKRLGFPDDAVAAEEAAELFEDKKKEQVGKQVACVWTLRILLAPVLESIIYLDRWMTTVEGMAGRSKLDEIMKRKIGDVDVNVWIWPLFEDVVSPRNIVLVAVK